MCVQSGHLETVHSYTNDQNLIDNYHKKTRRGRSAALNMVLTETGTTARAGARHGELPCAHAFRLSDCATAQVPQRLSRRACQTLPAS